MKRSVVNQFALANIATEELLRKAELQAAQQRAIQEAAKKSLEAVAAMRAGAPRPPPPPPSASLEDAPSKKRGRPADIDIINEVRMLVGSLCELRSPEHGSVRWSCAELLYVLFLFRWGGDGLPFRLFPCYCEFVVDCVLGCSCLRPLPLPQGRAWRLLRRRLTLILEASKRQLCLLACLGMPWRRWSGSVEVKTLVRWGSSSARSRREQGRNSVDSTSVM